MMWSACRAQGKETMCLPLFHQFIALNRHVHGLAERGRQRFGHIRNFLPYSIALALLLLPSHLLAAGGEKASATVIVADSRNLTGLTAWWVNVYNESHFYFALLTVVTIPLGGALLGGVADLLMARTGIDLRSRALREN